MDINKELLGNPNFIRRLMNSSNERLTLEELKDTPVLYNIDDKCKNNPLSLTDMKKDAIHFYLGGSKESHKVLLPRFYAALVASSKGRQEDDFSQKCSGKEEFAAKGIYSFVFRMRIASVTEHIDNNPMRPHLYLYHWWIIIDGLDGIYVQLIIPNICSSNLGFTDFRLGKISSSEYIIGTFSNFSNSRAELKKAMETMALLWVLSSQERIVKSLSYGNKDLIPHSYVKFSQESSFAFGYSTEDNEYFCHADMDAFLTAHDKEVFFRKFT